MTFAIGQRVKTRAALDIFPNISLQAGETGVVLWVHANPAACAVYEVVACVKLDTHHPELAEWDNELQIFGTEEGNSCGPEMHDLERV
jgi:hypothetical protein